MNSAAHLENLRMLASSLGIADEEASTRLDQPMQVSWKEEDSSAERLGFFVTELLSRTFRKVGTPSSPEPDSPVELIIQNAAQRTAGQQLHCILSGHKAVLGELGEREPTTVAPSIAPVCALFVACFASALVADRTLRLGKSAAVLNLDLEAIIGSANLASAPVDVGILTVAGAGAVGNAFAYALSLLPVHGSLAVIDPKPVTEGILHRCLCFGTGDIGRPKGERLADWLRNRSSGLEVSHFNGTVEDYVLSKGAEISCLVSGIDSRGGRRQLQEELPLEVFDASTTGIDEVVFHHNHAHEDGACLGCIYGETQGELDFERHVAQKLHVSVVDVRTGFITPAAAGRIVARYPALQAERLVGMAYHSLFKQLCATQQLVGPEQKQVLAPFAFVSQLAGTVLALELYLRRLSRPATRAFNYWRVSPWREPNLDLRTTRSRVASCSVCSDADYHSVIRELWGCGQTGDQ